MLAHFGTFDVENYGDLLFPLLVKRRMASIGIECVHVSPTGTTSPWRDALPSVSIEEARQMEVAFTSIIVGGGNILRDSPTSLSLYVSSSCATGRAMAYSALWRSAFSIARRRRIPLCWNAVGVPGPINTSFATSVRRGARLSNYISVRDRHSRNNLLDCGVSGPVRVVPDTALGICDLWSVRELCEAYAHLFGASSKPVPERVLAISVKRKYLTASPPEVGAVLDHLGNHLNATPVLLALGSCHGDVEVARSVAQYMKSKPILPTPRSLKEIAACIGHAVQYVGSSLHGAITAVSFGVPITIVANEELVPFHKFSGFLQQVGMNDALVRSWDDVSGSLRSHYQKTFKQGSLNSAFTIIETHWRDLCDALRNESR